MTSITTGVFDVTMTRALTQLHNRLVNDLATRKAHPTYGYTKASLRETLARLEGAAFATHALHNGFTHPDPGAAATWVLAELGVDLSELRARVEAA